MDRLDGRLSLDATADVPPPKGAPDVSPPMPDAPVAAPADVPSGCSGACIVGTKPCGATGGVQVCVDIKGCGAWAAETKCPGLQICAGNEPNAACACPAAPAGCAAGQGSFCESNATLATCVADAQGCVSISGRITCAAGKPCAGTHPTANCSCPPAPAACAAGTGTSCQGNTLITCANDSSGCVVVASTTACPAGKSCAGNAPNAACTCPAAPAGCNGQTSGTFCSSSAVATCAVDTNGCVATTTAACANGCNGSHPTASCCTPACTGKCGGTDGCGGTCPNNCAGTQTCGGGVTANVCGEPAVSCGAPMPNPASSGLPNPASYDTATAGVVIDKVTGLMWERAVTSTTYNQADAATYCTALRIGGFSNWRLPTRIELVSIVDFTLKGPAINATVFPSTPSSWFRTSSVVFGSPGDAWVVYFNYGYAGYHGVATGDAVRCVRADATAGPACPGPRFTVTSGWVLDATTKLNWQQTFGTSRTWDEAKADCTALGSGARLPSLNELQTIVDETKNNPAIDNAAFPSTPSSYFWTSSVVSGSPGSAWYVFFNSGYAYSNGVTSLNAVRCVR